MKNHKLLSASLVAGLVIIAGLMAYLAVPKSTAEAKSKDWVGSWNVVITVVNQNATFPGFMTFFSDGNVIADENPSPLETSGHGSWISTGKDQGAYTFVFLIGSTEPGQWITGTINGELKYDAQVDQWSGPFSIKLADQAGNEVLSDTGTMSGTRIAVQP
jgi:hypothetical protein